MNRLPRESNIFAVKSSTHYFEEIRSGLEWYMACRKGAETMVVRFSEWTIDAALRVVASYAADKGKPWFDWDDYAIMSERLRWHASYESLRVAFPVSGQEFEFYKALANSGCEVGHDLECAHQRWELLKECVKELECGK